ncbi:MAG TPA: DsbA family protein [Methylovirgula sp.]|jgi:protein-disulfide isomerase
MFRPRVFLTCFAALAFAVLVALPVGFAVADDTFTPAQKSEIEKILKDYIAKNPEIVRDALSALELRDKTAEMDARNKIITNLQGPLYTGEGQEIVGNANGKLTLVEFFDYNCGYCKKTLADIVQLMKDYPDLRVILKDYPILSDKSAEAATIALALRKQFTGAKFWDFHQRLLSQHVPVGRDEALAIAKDMGADMDRLTKDAAGADIKKALDDTDRLGQALMLNGTPSFVIGQEAIVGAIGYDAMKGKLENVKKCGKVACS